MAYRGKFTPKNPEKYKGDHTKIVYRSSWELKFFSFCDRSPDILWWQSEEVAIPYMSPIDGKMHRYFPDVLLCKKTTEGEVIKEMIEIKPEKQTAPPDVKNKNKTPTGRVSRRYLREVKTWGVNEAKWNAATKWCKANGFSFLIMTEKGTKRVI